MSTPDKRDELREKIEAAEARNEERGFADQARDASEAVTKFVKEHPLASIAGVAVIGLAIGAMTRPGRRLGHRAAGLAQYATEAGIAYGLGVLDAAGDATRHGGDWLEDLGDSFSSSARNARRDAGYFAATKRDAAGDFTRRTGRKAGRALRDTKAKLAR